MPRQKSADAGVNADVDALSNATRRHESPDRCDNDDAIMTLRGRIAVSRVSAATVIETSWFFSQNTGGRDNYLHLEMEPRNAGLRTSSLFTRDQGVTVFWGKFPWDPWKNRGTTSQ